MAHITIAPETAVFYVYTVTTSTTGPFVIPFEFFELDDVTVLWLADGDTDATTLVRDTDYTISATAVDGGYAKDGSITLLSAKANGKLTIKADYEISRTTDYTVATFDVTALNTQLDRLFAIMKQVKSLYTRSLRLTDSSPLTEVFLPAFSADELLKINSAADGIETVALGSISTSVDTLFSGLANNDMMVYNGSAWANKTPANTRTALGLGTAAVLDVGTTASKVVQLNGSAQLPAVDGSLLTGIGSSLPTGILVMSWGTSAPSGWVLVDGSTLGDTGSGADYTGSTYQNLYEFLWDNLADAYAPVSSGRGGSAAADFAAGKTITMPDPQGRAPVGTGTGSGLTARTNGDSGGSEDAIAVSHSHSAGTLAAASGGAHTHTVTLDVNGGSASPAKAGDSGSSTTVTTSSNGAHGHTISGSTASAGSSGTGANMMPWFATNYIIKL